MSQVISLDFDKFCERSDLNNSRVKMVFAKLVPETISGVWLAGGAIRRTLIKQPLDSDFDFFFKSQDTLDEWVKQLPEDFKLTKETAHHKQFEGKIDDQDVIVQAIFFQFYTNTSDLLDSFDYTISQFAWFGDKLYTTPEALWDLARRRLAINKVTYPVATMRRMLKYSKQGFTVCGGCMADLFRKTMENPTALGALDIQYID